MNIIADENIPYVRSAFSHIGEVTTLSGRDMQSTDIRDVDILLVRSVTKVNHTLLHGSKVKFVASATAGINHIDTQYLGEHGIHFAHAPGSNAISAAEYVISGICYWALKENRRFDQICLGVVGFGNVGKLVVHFARLLGMDVTANDPPLEDSNSGEKLSSLEETLDCDIVTLHVPLSFDGPHKTHHLISHEKIQQIRSNSLLINAARGGVVCEESLLDRIVKKNDLSLIFDVWEDEPNLNHTLLCNTLIGTPHIAGYSMDGKIRGTEMIYNACCRYLQIDPIWKSEDVLDPLDSISEQSNTSEDIRKKILAAYDILADNLQLKDPLLKDMRVAPEYFDSLRKNYPVRREFMQRLLSTY